MDTNICDITSCRARQKVNITKDSVKATVSIGCIHIMLCLKEGKYRYEAILTI